MTTAVLLPALLVGFSAERLFFAKAQRLDTVGCNPGLRERSFHRIGTAVTQGNVVVGRSTLVAVAFDGDLDSCVLLQEINVTLQGGLLIGANVRSVVVEVDVLHLLGEQFFI